MDAMPLLGFYAASLIWDTEFQVGLIQGWNSTMDSFDMASRPVGRAHVP